MAKAAAAVEFEALDVSAFIPPEDSEEVAALKKRVEEVAAKYTKTHGWCEEVKNALKEIGIGAAPSMRVQVNLIDPLGSITVLADPAKLLGKTAKQQLKEVMKGSADSAAFTVGSKRMILDADKVMSLVTGLEVAPKSVMDPVNPIHAWRVLSNGKVAHLMQDFYNREAKGYYVYTFCGSSSSEPSETTEPRSSTTKCRRCTPYDV